ncbi:hypothetical protein CFP56_039941 [Quercus suber]|uniref:Uncharacterized protein n=1 Tax=Quercus suber TaxID=58331 RepID=A0AAW0IYU1_QUESU
MICMITSRSESPCCWPVHPSGGVAHCKHGSGLAVNLLIVGMPTAFNLLVCYDLGGVFRFCLRKREAMILHYLFY